jgi:hypothetical protein
LFVSLTSPFPNHTSGRLLDLLQVPIDMSLRKLNLATRTALVKADFPRFTQSIQRGQPDAEQFGSFFSGI